MCSIDPGQPTHLLACTQLATAAHARAIGQRGLSSTRVRPLTLLYSETAIMLVEGVTDGNAGCLPLGSRRHHEHPPLCCSATGCGPSDHSRVMQKAT